MKSFVFSLVIICLIASAAVAQTDTAAGATSSEMFLGGGSAIPSLPFPFHDFWAPGFTIIGGYGWTLKPGTLGYGTIYATIEYNHFFFDRDGMLSERQWNPATIDVKGNPTYALTAMAVFKGTFAQSFDELGPYFLLGLGGMSITSGEINRTTGTSPILRPKQTKTGITWEIGAGIDFPVNNRFRAFAETKYYMAFTSDPGRQYFPIYAGLRYTLQ